MPTSFTPRAIARTLIVLAVGQTIAIASLTGHAGLVGDAGDDETGAGPTYVAASSSTSESSGGSPPAVVAVIDGTEGDNGWYVSDVALTWDVSDDDDAITSTDGCDAESVTEDTVGTTFGCTATSDGGSTTTTVVIARDTTAPNDVAVEADRDPDNNGYYTAPFTATWSGTDATSGIASCTATTYAGPDVTGGSIDGTCVDEAGNESDTVSFAFSYDASAPVVTGTPDRAPDHNGWYTAPVTITWSSDDTDATCDGPTVYSGPDAAAAEVTGTCTDDAGNAGMGSVELAYDATGPSITLSSPAEGAILILNQPVTASYSCSDATAGIASCDGTVADGAALDTSSVGEKTFRVEAGDEAGNTTVIERTYNVQYQPAGVLCDGVRGHQILQPISVDGSSVFKRNSTVPAKFRVCDWFGASVTTPGVVESFEITGIDDTATVRSVPSTTPHQGFRAGDTQWIFNINTRAMPAGSAFDLLISLDDGTTIPVAFHLR